jgi:hypothetical protein
VIADRRLECRRLLTLLHTLDGQFELLVAMDVFICGAGLKRPAGDWQRMKRISRRSDHIRKILNERFAREQEECCRMDCRHLDWPLAHAH